jgi:hypothetical protein
VDSLVRAFGVTAVGSEQRGNTALIIAMLATAGAIVVLRRRRGDGFVVMGMVVLPIVIALAGLAMTQHWFAMRYVTPALPAYLLLAAVAVDSAVRAATRRLPEAAERWATPAAVALLAFLLAAQTLEPARSESHRKLNWRAIAATIWSHARHGDVVATAEPWSEVSLRFYLHRLPARLRVRSMAVAEQQERAWLLTAGHSSNPAGRDALCRYPILLASELEDFRLHYAPGLHDFLRHRSSEFELRGLAGRSLGMAAGDDLFLGRGWSASEGGSRWATGHRAEVILPLAAGRTVIDIRVTPLVHRSLPPQVMTVRLNGGEPRRFTLAEGWNSVAVEFAAREGINVLAFEFSRANSPASLESALSDPRPLAALFDHIEIGGRRPNAEARYIRIHETGPGYLDASTAWRDHESRFDPRSWNDERVRALLARLGYDPEIAMPRLRSGHVALEDLLAATALLGGCEDATEFVRRFWRVVFAKDANVIEERVLLSILQKSGSRAEFARRIARMSEFKKLL